MIAPIFPVSIPDRVLGFFRLSWFSHAMSKIAKVSIPDRVLGFFRLVEIDLAVAGSKSFVSIPDRVLGFFRLCLPKVSPQI